MPPHDGNAARTRRVRACTGLDAASVEAGRDGFWLACWLRARGIESQVIHPTSIPVSCEHRRAKTDRLDIGLLKRAVLGWRRGESSSMAVVPTRERENLVGERTRIINRLKAAFTRLGIRGFNPKLHRAPQRLQALRTLEGQPIPPNTLAELQRDMARLRFIRDQTKEIERARLQELQSTPERLPRAMVQLVIRMRGVGIETADMLANEALLRNLRDRRAVTRCAGLTGSPDDSGCKRREKGLAKTGNARVRRGMSRTAACRAFAAMR